MTPTPDDPPSKPAEPAVPDRHDLPRDFLFPALRSEPESFPVLKAFQEYLEEERERARKRLVTVSVLAISALVLVVAAFLAVGAKVIGNLARRNDQLQEIVLRAAIRDLAAPAASAPASRAETPSPELDRLQESLQHLQADNAVLQSRVTALQDLPATLAASVSTTLSNLAARSAAPTTATGQPRPGALPPPTSAPFAPAAKRPATAPFAPTIVATAAVPAAQAPVVAQAAAPRAPTEARPGDTSAPQLTATKPPATAASSSRPKDPKARVVLSIPTETRTPLRIEGHQPAQLMLVTDRGVRIPWRIVLPDPQ